MKQHGLIGLVIPGKLITHKFVQYFFFFFVTVLLTAS
jgi:hypothetical protein